MKEIPIYLRPYVATQDPALYSAMDHAAWRYILKLSLAFFKEHAHQMYQDGLKKTGITLDRIPLISEMDEKLSKFGWAAVPVTGFIPPEVFMEFLSLGILPIACDMRNLEHISYTPAPDIVHEAAGHAPIIADPDYADYLKTYGEISRKAIYTDQDLEVYQAIRNLSDTKERPNATEQEIDKAQGQLDLAVKAQVDVSEAALLARMGWWTFEYGLIGTLKDPKIYGAGLLSSLGESFNCLEESVKKIPFSLSCIDVSYDITKPQPQLFVAESFSQMKQVLNDLADQMAFRVGGLGSLEKAKKANTVTTTVLDSGIQITGVVHEVVEENGKVIYLKFSGPCQLSCNDIEIVGQGARHHPQGFGTPVEPVTFSDLKNANLFLGQRGKLVLKSGVQVEGVLQNLVQNGEQIILLSFTSCRVTRGSEVLFQPEWGQFDMACGQSVVSVFGGAADRGRYLVSTQGVLQESFQQKSNLTKDLQPLNALYEKLDQIRQSDSSSTDELDQIVGKLEDYPSDWLLRYQLLEFSQSLPSEPAWKKKVERSLIEIRDRNPEKKKLIERGLKALQ